MVSSLARPVGKFDRADVLSIAVHEDLRGIESLARMRCLDSFPPSLTRKGRPWMRWVFPRPTPPVRTATGNCPRLHGGPPSYFFNRRSECGVLLPKRLGKAVAANSLQGIRVPSGCRPARQRHHQFNEEPAFAGSSSEDAMLTGPSLR